jgi:hypothetical protein
MARQHIKSTLAWIGTIAAAALVVAIVLLTTEVGAAILARVRCAAVWVTSDATAYRACADVEREQILEHRRHQPDD